MITKRDKLLLIGVKMKRIFIICIVFLILSASGEAAYIKSFSIFSDKQTAQPSKQHFILTEKSRLTLFSYTIKGCNLRHKLCNKISLECPKGVKVKGKQARVLKLLDLEADKAIRADKLWNKGITGKTQSVIIIDTGIDRQHSELAGKVVKEWDFVEGDNIAQDEHGHGTIIAGIIAGRGIRNIQGNYAKGVAPDVKLYILKVCDGNGVCYEDDVLAALEYAKKLPAKIVSISLGVGNYNGNCDNDELAKAVNELAESGKIVVVAAGNDGRGISSPACASKAVAVSAVDKQQNVPWWSNRGYSLDLLAPGEDVLSSYSSLAEGDFTHDYYAKLTGTSASAPIVAGSFALLLQAFKKATINDVKQAVYDTAQMPDACYTCNYIIYGRCYNKHRVSCSKRIIGNGIIDVFAAYEKLKKSSSEPKDTDGDGVPNYKDLCPTKYGKDCNGCPNPCSGCAKMVCSANKKPSCTAGYCSPTKCPSDGCGKDKCSADEWADFPSFVSNSCYLKGNHGYCTHNSCEGKAVCRKSTRCQQPSEQVKCWSKDYKYLSRSSSSLSKFCKCTAGSYGYSSYSYQRKRSTAYKYVDYRNNENWRVRKVITYYPVYSVKCNDGKWYSTNEDYYY